MKNEVEQVMELIQKSRPQNAFDKVRDVNIGMIGALDFLYEQGEEVRSKDISEALNISSARMAILLKKLEAKGFIEKTKSSIDGRSANIIISNKGWQFVHRIKESMAQTAQQLIDEFGFDALVILIAQMEKFHGIMYQGIPTISEENHD